MIERIATAVSISAVVLCLASPALAQTPKESDMKSEVPALTAMHDVIAPMWHDAWPKKDTAALAGMAPEIAKHMAAIEKAQLPGILRDKASAWTAGVAKLRESVTAFKASAAANDEAGLLKAAEAVHTNYENLGKVVRPVLKEVDDFHTSLYVLYHYQLEPLNEAKVIESIKAMKPKMDALNAAVLPDRLKAKQDAFAAQRARLSKAFDEVFVMVSQGPKERLKAGIEQMHIEYEKLEQIF